MRERFRYPWGDGFELLVAELPGPRGSVWALLECRADRRGTVAVLHEGTTAGAVVGECARRLAECHGGKSQSWEALVRESVEASF